LRRYSENMMKTLGIFRTKLEQFSRVLFSVSRSHLPFAFYRCLVRQKKLVTTTLTKKKPLRFSVVCGLHSPANFLPCESLSHILRSDPCYARCSVCSPPITGTGVHKFFARPFCVLAGVTRRFPFLSSSVSVVFLPCLLSTISHASVFYSSCSVTISMSHPSMHSDEHTHHR